jgi:hypothetical protein
MASLVALAACGDGHSVGKFRADGQAMAPTIENGEQFEVTDYDGGALSEAMWWYSRRPRARTGCSPNALSGCPGVY